jgi:hypothetical protein
MPHYVPSELPYSGYVVDAERLQQELERVEATMQRLDQHNFKTGSLLPDRFRAPSSEGDTYFVAFDGGSILLDELASAQTIATVDGREQWEWLQSPGSTYVELNVTLTRASYLHMECSLEADPVASSNCWLDVQVTLDGQRTGAAATIFFGASNAKSSAYAADAQLVLPGDHTIRVRVRQRTGTGAQVTKAVLIARGTPA